MADESVCIPREIQISGYYYINLVIDVYEVSKTESSPQYWAAAEATLIVTDVDSREEAMEKLEEMWAPWESAWLG